MVKIRNGKLVLPRGYANLSDLSEAVLKPPHEPKTDDEPVAVVSSIMRPCAVPWAVITFATQDIGGSFIHLFWAEDEDNGGQEVLVAWDTKMMGLPEQTEDEDKRWFIVVEGRWTQAPFGKEFVQLFKNKGDALRYLDDHEVVVVPTDTVPGWKAVIVDGRYEYCFSEINEHPELVRILEFPDGLEIDNLLETRDVKLGEVLIDAPDAKGIADYCVERIVVTSNGEVFIIASTENGDAGKKIIGRRFTHEEAKKVLRL